MGAQRRRDGGRLALVEILQLAINGLAVGCIYGLIALGFVLIYKATEVVNFAQGDLLMLGAFAAFTLMTLYEIDYWIGFLLAVAIMAAFGAALDKLVLRRIIGQPQFAMIMLTIGLGFMFRSAASMTWGTQTYSIASPFSAQVASIGGVVVSMEYVAIIVGTLLLCGILYAFFQFTRIGVAMQAASQNQLAAYYMGIPVKLVSSMIWAISAAVAAVAGVLLAPVSLIEVNMGLLGLKAFAAAVLGGFGSVPGALVGGLIIGLIELFSSAYDGVLLPSGFKDIAAYVVLLAVLVVRPQGLFGQTGRKKV